MMDFNTLLTLDLAEYTTALEALADQMMLEEPRDIDYMRRRKLDTGREFAVWNFTVGYCMTPPTPSPSCEPRQRKRQRRHRRPRNDHQQRRAPVRLVLGRLRRHRQNG